MNTRTMYLLTALALALAAVEPSSADSQVNPVQDYWSASKASLQVAKEHSRHNETTAACEALTKSLDYYRMALAKETGTPPSQFGSGLGDDEGMREIRARFGCLGPTA